MNEIASDFKKMDVRTDQRKRKNNDKTNQNAKKKAVVTGNRRNRELIIEILGESDDEDNDDHMTKVSEPVRVENAISTRKTFKLKSCLKKTSPYPQQTNPNSNSQPPIPPSTIEEEATTIPIVTSARITFRDPESEILSLLDAQEPTRKWPNCLRQHKVLV